MVAALQILEVARVNRIMQALQDIRELPQELVFSGRLPDVPAADNEIMARFIGRVQIADLVADDQRAVVYSSGKLSFESTTVPNLKHGVNLTQEMLNQLLAIEANGGIQHDDGLFSQYENRTVDGLLLGIRQRKEALAVAMAIDGFSYDRLGIKMSNVSWGMPADLKPTVSITWDNAATATPVDDILTLKLVAKVRYGQEFDRMSMSTTAFRLMVGTTNFQNHARFVLPPGSPTSILPLQNIGYQKNLAQSVLGIREIELYDARYWSQDETGALTSAPYLPITKVVFSSIADDNDPMVADFANGVVTETIVSGLAPTNIVGRFGGPQRGPIAYATATSDLNPPQITYWGVARGFTRKHRLQSTACMTVGTFVDSIAVGVPF